MRLTIFDLDHTLLTVNSSFRFGVYLYHQNFFSVATLFLCLTDYIRHKWLRMSIEKLHAKSFARLFKGQAFQDIHQHVKKFLLCHLSSMLYSPVVQRLQAARERGDYVVILSSSPDFLVREIASYLQVQHWGGTIYQVDEKGRFSQISQIMEGEDKACYVQALAHQMKIPFAAITVYSDSYLDLPVLKIAGQAIAVDPDSRLKRICLQNGWEIL